MTQEELDKMTREETLANRYPIPMSLPSVKRRRR